MFLLTFAPHRQLTLRLCTVAAEGKLDRPSSPVLGCRVRVRPSVLSYILYESYIIYYISLYLSRLRSTSSPLQARLGRRARGAGGAEHSARLLPAYRDM